MSEDWLDTEEPTRLVPVSVAMPATYAERIALVSQCWSRLDTKQQTFLTMLRENRFNARRAAAKLEGVVGRTSHIKWMHEEDYQTVFRVWQSIASEGALDRDKLLARQDDIVETLLTPKPIFHQGLPILGTDGKPYEEVEAGAAGKANEVLMKAAGLLKDKEVDINIGIVVGPPTLNIQVMPTPPSKVAVLQSVAIDAKFTEVPDGDEWLGT